MLVPQINCTYTPEDKRFPPVTALISSLDTFDSTTFLQTVAQNFSEMDFSSLLRFTAVRPLGNMFYDSNKGAAIKTPNDTEVTTCSMELCIHAHRNVFVRNGMLVSENYTTQLPSEPDRLDTNHSYGVGSVGEYTVRDPASNASGTYQVSSRTMSNWQGYFSEFFTMLLGDSGESGTIFEQRGSDIPSTAALYLYTSNISEVVDNVARTVTHLMRSEDNHNATQMLGDTYVAEVYIHVNWIWLAIPLLITSFSVLLLVMAILQSSSNVVLKSSAIACLFHGLRGWPEDELGECIPARETPESLNTVAERMRARFEKGEDGHLRFSRAS